MYTECFTAKIVQDFNVTHRICKTSRTLFTLPVLLPRVAEYFCILDALTIKISAWVESYSITLFYIIAIVMSVKNPRSSVASKVS